MISTQVIKKSKFLLKIHDSGEDQVEKIKQIKKKLQNYNIDEPRNNDQKIDVQFHFYFHSLFFNQDCLEMMQIEKDKRQALELQIIENGLSNCSFIQKLIKKGYDKQVKESYRVLKPLSLKKGECLFYQGEFPEYFYILVRGKLQILTLKDNETMEREKKNYTSNELNNMQNIITLLQQKKDSHTYLSSTSPNPANDKVPGVELNLPSPIQGILSVSSSPPGSPNQSVQQERKRSSMFMSRFGDKQKNKNTLNESQFDYKDQDDDSQQQDENQEESENGDEQQQLASLNKILSSSHQINIKESSSKHKISSQLPANMNIDEIAMPSKLFNNGVFIYSNANILISGDSLGEAGLLMRRARSATVLCLEDCNFAILNALEYNAILKEVQHKNVLKKINTLMEAMESNIPFMTASRLSFAMFKITLSFDQPVFIQGEVASYMYFLKRGEVEISYSQKIFSQQDQLIQDNDGDQNETPLRLNGGYKLKNFLVSCIGSGSFFGEEDILKNNLTRTYTARVRSSFAKVYRIKESEFKFLLSQSGSMREFFAKRFNNQVQWRKEQQRIAHKSEELIQNKAKIVERQINKRNLNQETSCVEDIDKIIQFCQDKSIISNQSQVKQPSLFHQTQQSQLQLVDDKLQKQSNDTSLLDISQTKELTFTKTKSIQHNNNSSQTSIQGYCFPVRLPDKIYEDNNSFKYSPMKTENSFNKESHQEKSCSQNQINESLSPNKLFLNKQQSQQQSLQQNQQIAFSSQQLRSENKKQKQQDYNNSSIQSTIKFNKDKKYIPTHLQQQQEQNYRLNKGHVTSKRPQSAMEVFTSSNFFATANAENKEFLKKFLEDKKLAAENEENGIIFGNEYLEKVKQRIEKFQRTLILKKQQEKEQEEELKKKKEQNSQSVQPIISKPPSPFCNQQSSFSRGNSPFQRGSSPSIQNQLFQLKNDQRESSAIQYQKTKSNIVSEPIEQTILNSISQFRQSKQSISKIATRAFPTDKLIQFTSNTDSKTLLLKKARLNLALRKSSMSYKSQHLQQLMEKEYLNELGDFPKQEHHKQQQPQSQQQQEEEEEEDQIILSITNNEQQVHHIKLSDDYPKASFNNQSYGNSYVYNTSTPISAVVSRSSSISSSIKNPVDQYFIQTSKNGQKSASNNKLSSFDTLTSYRPSLNRKKQAFSSHSSAIKDQSHQQQLFQSQLEQMDQESQDKDHKFDSSEQVGALSQDGLKVVVLSRQEKNKQSLNSFFQSPSSPTHTPLTSRHLNRPQTSCLLSTPHSPIKKAIAHQNLRQTAIHSIYMVSDGEFPNQAATKPEIPSNQTSRAGSCQQFNNQNVNSNNNNNNQGSQSSIYETSKLDLEKILIDWNAVRFRKEFISPTNNLRSNKSEHSMQIVQSASPRCRKIRRQESKMKQMTSPQNIKGIPKSLSKPQTPQNKPSVINLAFPKNTSKDQKKNIKNNNLMIQTNLIRI